MWNLASGCVALWFDVNRCWGNRWEQFTIRASITVWEMLTNAQFRALLMKDRMRHKNYEEVGNLGVKSYKLTAAVTHIDKVPAEFLPPLVTAQTCIKLDILYSNAHPPMSSLHHPALAFWKEKGKGGRRERERESLWSSLLLVCLGKECARLGITHVLSACTSTCTQSRWKKDTDRVCTLACKRESAQWEEICITKESRARWRRKIKEREGGSEQADCRRCRRGDATEVIY